MSIREGRKQLDELQQRRGEIERESVAKAKVVGATLAKSWLRPEVYESGFDPVVVDD